MDDLPIFSPGNGENMNEINGIKRLKPDETEVVFQDIIKIQASEGYSIREFCSFVGLEESEMQIIRRVSRGETANPGINNAVKIAAKVREKFPKLPYYFF